MFLKIMGDDKAPDDDSRKMFSIHTHVTTVEFVRRDGSVFAEVVFEDYLTETFPVPQNAYVMNEAGEIVASFGSAEYRRAGVAAAGLSTRSPL